MSEIQYITWDELLHVYEKTVDESGGGFSGIRDRERLESVLEFVQNDMYYPTFEDKLTFLVSRICTGHLFDDGNKRMSLTLGVYFLHKNGRFWAATTFMTHMIEKSRAEQNRKRLRMAQVASAGVSGI